MYIFAAVNYSSVKHNSRRDKMGNNLGETRMENSNNNETQSRRQFFKEAAKKALPILGTVALKDNSMIAQTIQKVSTDCNHSSCSNTCKTTCETMCGKSCIGYCRSGCDDYCAGSCKEGCAVGCKGGCNGSCEGSCLNSCKGSNEQNLK